MIQFDLYVSDGLKPPTSFVLKRAEVEKNDEPETNKQTVVGILMVSCKGKKCKMTTHVFF